MTSTLIAVLVPLGYLTGWLLFARWYFQLKRPYVEPLSCANPVSHSHCGVEHTDRCYQRPGTIIGSATEAAVIAALLGLLWPFMLAGYGFGRAVTGILGPAGKPLPEETAAREKRLMAERDGSDLRKEAGR